MVKNFFKYIFYILMFLIAFVYFVPKTNLYYLIEKYLVKYDVVISDEKLAERGFNLNIKNMHISVQGVDSATVENGDIILLLLYNKVNLKNIKLSSVMQDFLPTHIEKTYPDVVKTGFTQIGLLTK
jgi:hypothetical protein